MAIAIRQPKEIEKLKIASSMVGKTLQYLTQNVKIGMSLKEVDRLGEEFILSLGGTPSFKGLYGFPASIITSLNNVIIHGVPTDDIIKDGDILGLDLGVKYDGYYGDGAVTLGMGTISPTNQKLIEDTEYILYKAISEIKEGMRFKELSQILETLITSKGYVPLKDFCGHGIGRLPHEEPNIPNYLDGKPNQGPKIRNGMVFCLEPMVCQSSGQPIILDDKWSVVSDDMLNNAHFEHTVAIINNKAEILTIP